MSRKLSSIRFRIQKDSNRGWVLIREGGDYGQHAHVSTKNGARQLRCFIRNQQLPRSEYLQESCRRLLSRDEYQRLRRPKPNYNNNKRMNQRG